MIGTRASANALLVGLSLLAVFHLLMMLGVFPEDIAWGGGAGSSGSMLLLEVTALVVTLLFALVVAARAGYLGPQLQGRPAAVAMWIVFGYFVLNTAGNLASPSSLESAVFTPVSVILALLALRLAASRK
jgi:hypothetical protein